MVTRDDLDTLVLSIVQIARTQIIPRLTANEDLAPCLFVADSAMNVIGIVQIDLPENYDERVRLDAVLRHRLYEMQASAYAFTMMGWMVELARGESSTVRPSDHPNKIETFIITAGSSTEHLTRMYKVVRKRGKINLLEDKTLPGEAREMGLFVDMLAALPAGTKTN